jgi:glutamine synthetase
MCAVLRNAKTVRDVFRTIKERNVLFVDLKWVDLFGGLLHVTLPIDAFDEKMFIEGLAFDASSVRGFQEINDSDMLIKPDASTMFIDPFMDDPTISFFCNIVLPGTHQIYSRDPRAVAHKAERFLSASGIADTSFFGPELEFFLFDDVRFGQNTHEGFYSVDSSAAFWNSGRVENHNLGFKPGQKKGYGVVGPTDVFHNLRAKMCLVLQDVGVTPELHHPEVASGGQNEIGIRFDTLVKMADNAIKYKYVVKNVARRYQKAATFMPKPLFEENGTGMHVNMSLWKKGVNLFYESDAYGDLSQEGVYFIGGLLHHAPALCALCNPTTNSYRRLVPGYEAPINLAYSASNRSACVRIPMGGSPKAKRVEYRTPDPTANPYLAFSALLMAGLDGIINKIEPPAPVDEDIYEMSQEELDEKGVKGTPGTLYEALKALEADHDFLLRGDVFTPDLLEMWLKIKYKQDVDYIRLRPHPGEFALYFDA